MKTLIDCLVKLPEPQSYFPQTTLYNEGWLLRAILSECKYQETGNSILAFMENSVWYSEARLPAAFPPRFRGDKIGSRRTNADGVIGHFQVGLKSKTGLELNRDASQFVVLEAKMSSRFSPSTSKHRNYNQASRNVADMAMTIYEAGRIPSRFDSLGFFVLAPKAKIEEGVFDEVLRKPIIRAEVENIVKQYEGTKHEWFEDWFLPTLKAIEISAFSWDQVLEDLTHSPNYEQLVEFYERCLKYN